MSRTRRILTGAVLAIGLAGVPAVLVATPAAATDIGHLKVSTGTPPGAVKGSGNEASTLVVTTDGTCPGTDTNFLVSLSGSHVATSRSNLVGNSPLSSAPTENGGYRVEAPQAFTDYLDPGQVPTGTYSLVFTCKLALGAGSGSTFPGSITFGGLTSGHYPWTWDQAPTTTTSLSPSASNVAPGTNVTLTATVGSPGGQPFASTPAGVVRFYDGATEISNAASPPVLDGTGHATYSTSSLSAGSHNLTATFVSSNDLNRGSTSAVSTVTVTAPATPAPTAGTAPSIGTTGVVGQTLTCSGGSVTNATSTSITWRRDGTDIPGATGPSYTLAVADFNHGVTCALTGTNSSGSATVVSSTVHVGAGPVVKATAAAKIAGTAKVGKTLKATAAKFPHGGVLKYQWLRNGKPIKKATKASYKLTKADKNHKISVRETLVATGYASSTSTSKAVTVK